MSALLLTFLCLASEGGLLAVDGGALAPIPAAAWDQVGEALALAGDTAALGVRWSDAAAPDAGAVVLFARGAGAWTQGATLVASDAAQADELGYALDLDGATLVAGAPTADVLGSNEGAVYVFGEVGGVWSQAQKLSASDLADGDRFGSAVALQGDTLLVGAPGDDDLGDWSGSVYVFTRAGGWWTERAKLTANDGTPLAYFGSALDLDGDTALVGAPGASGGAYVFVGAAASWTQQAKLTDSGQAAGDRFGESVALLGDRAVAGAPLDDDNGLDAGSLCVFDRSVGLWSQTARLLAGEQLGELGRAAALGPDRCVAGAPRDYLLGSAPRGAVYLFELGSGGWAQAAQLGAPGGVDFDDFGAALALAGDDLLVGAPGADAAAINAGVVRAWTLVPGMRRYCFGDGSGTACPCVNVGGADAGCANSTGAGAKLRPLGTPSVAANDMTLAAEQLVPGQPALLFAGLNAVNGGAGTVFGDGLRCAGGGVVRLGVHAANAGGATQWTGIAALQAAAPGDTRRYQAWYRDPAGSPCGSAFNLSNGVEATFIP